MIYDWDWTHSSTRPKPRRVGTGSKITKKKDEIRAWLIGVGWEEDRFGHMQKQDASQVQFRMKFAKTVVRLEVHRNVFPGQNQWYRLRSEYYNRVTKDFILSWPHVV